MRRRDRIMLWLIENGILPIDLPWCMRWGTTVAALFFLGMWQLAEHRERYALDLSAATVQTNAQCMAGYWASERLLGNATRALSVLVTGQ